MAARGPRQAHRLASGSAWRRAAAARAGPLARPVPQRLPYLRAHELRTNGAPPRLLVVSDALGSGAVHELTNPDIVLDDGGVLPLQSLRSASSAA
jgi:hypothetical protein